jgi:hypothetical protein
MTAVWIIMLCIGVSTVVGILAYHLGRSDERDAKVSRETIEASR